MKTLIAATVAALALIAAGCTPVTESASAADPLPGQSVDAASCAARGGEIRRVGRMQSEQCISLYADAGRQCSDGDDCQGDCRVVGDKTQAPGTAATGQCSPDSSRFGCHATIEDGRIDVTLCVD